MNETELNPINKKSFDAFILHDRAINSNPCTLYNHKSHMRMFLGKIKSNWNKVDQEVIDDFFANAKLSDTSKETMKPVIKAFYRFHKMPEVANMIISNPKVLARPTKDKESVLTPDEIERLIEAHHDLSRKAFIETFIVTGARKEEIRMLNLGDVRLDGNLVWVNIRKPKGTSPNIKPRDIPIAPSPDNPVARYPEHLVAWVKSRKNESPDRPLFVSNSYQRKFNGNRLTEQGVYNIFIDIKQKAGVTRKITPHICRHTSATYDGATLNESMLCQKYGWVIGSTMARRYCHFNEQVLGEQILKRAGLKREESKKGKVCPRCGEPNNLFAEECTKCNQILDAKKLMELATQEETRISGMQQEMEKLRTELNQVRSLFKKAIDINQHPEYYWTEEERKKYEEKHKEYERKIEEKDRIMKEKITAQEAEERAKMTPEEIKKERQLFLQVVEEAKRTGENVPNKPIKQPKTQQKHEDTV